MGARDYRSDWFQDDRLFFREWERGAEYEDLVLRDLKTYDLPATAGARGFRDGLDSRRDWKNQADIWVARFRIEVRSVGVAFINPIDWPQFYVPVDPVWKFDGKDPRPDAYVFISRESQAKLVVWTQKKAGFRVEKGIRDPKRGTTDDWYVVDPLEYLRPFDRFVAYLKGELTKAQALGSPFPDGAATTQPAPTTGRLFDSGGTG